MHHSKVDVTRILLIVLTANPMKSLHYNNHISSKQDPNEVAKQIFTEILENSDRELQLSIDDGDGDVWVYKISWYCDRIEPFTQLKEN